jgi:hypothetical protein
VGNDLRMKGQLYVVIRVDGTINSPEEANDRIAVTKVLSDFEEAAKEVERLNKLNGSKGAYYLVFRETSHELISIVVNKDDSVRPAGAVVRRKVYSVRRKHDTDAGKLT